MSKSGLWKAYIGRNLQAIKGFACPVSPASAGCRDFFSTRYKEYTGLNPRFRFMLRSAHEIPPYIMVEYGEHRVAALGPASSGAGVAKCV